MIEIRGARDLLGKKKDLFIESNQDVVIDANNLLLFPAMIDPHVHFRTPGQEYKENWISASKAALFGGITTVFDMPNNIPSCTTRKHLIEKKRLIEEQLQKSSASLRYFLYFGADRKNLDEIEKVKDDVIAIKVFMGSSTGNLLIDDDEVLENIFQIASKCNLPIAIHAEDEKRIEQRKSLFKGTSAHLHSLIRDPESACIAIRKAASLAYTYKVKLYILHVSSILELQEIRKAKKTNPYIYAEATLNHLFLDDSFYEKYGTRVLVNPPLRTKEDQEELFKALNDQTIDTIGTDHAPHTLEEKMKPFPEAPSGLPGIETALPLLLNAAQEGKITLKRIQELTSQNIQNIFTLDPINDLLLIDPDYKRKVRIFHSQTGFTPFMGKTLQGWPLYAVLKNKIFDLSEKTIQLSSNLYPMETS